ncbi:MAG: response regulator transcription factor [Firmicutes bacterium]|jgi:two-component system response regulator ResD|nr:response regulator transcription factor [Bacillota bacterium]
MAECVKILVVEDEARMRDLLRLYLEREGYWVVEADNGKKALEKVAREEFALIILDVMLPGMDGLKVCQEIRRTHAVPIIMLTARGEEIDRITGFELGADDYVVKPFSPRELVMRVKALLRRSCPQPAGRDVLTFPGLSIDHPARRVEAAGHEVSLTPKEYDLLYFLASQAGRVFTREQLLEKVWGYDFYGDQRTVDTHIKNLREKLKRAGRGAEHLVTVWGVGYKFEVKA